MQAEKGKKRVKWRAFGRVGFQALESSPEPLNIAALNNVEL